MLDYVLIGAVVTAPIWILGSLCVWEHTVYKRKLDSTNSGAKFG